MKTLVFISILVGAPLALNAQEAEWEGTHRIVSSTEGDSFNPRKAETFCQITEKDGQLKGSITMFGVDAHEKSPDREDREKLQGTIRRQIVEWKSGRSWEDEQKRKRQYETIFRGVRDGDTIVGYFEQTWEQTGKASITYRGIVELNRKQKD